MDDECTLYGAVGRLLEGERHGSLRRHDGIHAGEITGRFRGAGERQSKTEHDDESDHGGHLR